MLVSPSLLWPHSSFCFFFFLRFLFYVDHISSLYWICCDIAFVVYVLVFWPGGLWDLSFQTRDWTLTPCIGRWNLYHWISGEVPIWPYPCPLSLPPLLPCRSSQRTWESSPPRPSVSHVHRIWLVAAARKEQDWAWDNHGSSSERPVLKYPVGVLY